MEDLKRLEANAHVVVTSRLVIRMRNRQCSLSTHSPNKILFIYYIQGNYGLVKMGNGKLSKTKGIGNFCLNTNSGTELVLQDVKYMYPLLK